ncbi:MAG: metallopeptidase TldD-related protein [Corallococcus sp.]|nr:metallopeptidase TldD-related protein [Corallococcus sp.]
MKKEIIVKKQKKQTINISASAVESFRINDDAETTVRVYDGKYIGIAGKQGDCDIKSLEKTAQENLKQQITYPEINDEAAEISSDTRKEILSADKYIPQIKQLLAKLTEQNPDFIFSNKVIMLENEVSYSTDYGRKLYYAGNELDLSLVMKHKSSANIMDESIGCDADYYDEAQILADAKLICDNFNRKLPQIAEDEIPVIFDGAEPIGYLINHFVGDLYASGASLICGKLGQKVFADNLGIVLDRSEKTLNIPFFDAEGVVNEGHKAYLVKNGVVNRLITTKKTAVTYGLDNAGCAEAGYTSVPSMGARRLKLEKTHENLREILGNGKAVFVTTSSGGDATPTGDVSIPCMVSYLYENGELKGKLPEFSVSGNLLDMLGKNYMGCAEKGIFAYGNHSYMVIKAKLVNKAQ